MIAHVCSVVVYQALRQSKHIAIKRAIGLCQPIANSVSGALNTFQCDQDGQ